MKRSSSWLNTLIFLPLILVGGIFFWWKNGLSAVDSSRKEKITFVITKGESVSEISLNLRSVSLIKDPFLFKALVFLNGTAKKIQAGNYYLSPSMSTEEIAKTLTLGTNDQRVKIIEGLREEQIAELLVAEGFPINLSEWNQEIKTSKLEGKIFPDTYSFPKNASQGAILKIISKNFQKKVMDDLNAEIQESKLSLNEILVLSSIVEREAQKDTDRKMIAGILLKRWQSDWPLQADATVQYAVASAKFIRQIGGQSSKLDDFGWWTKGLTQDDLKIKSPYNTYLNPGLPPSPICNPGLASIKAVLSPQNSSYWFYLSDSKGETHYAENSEEHNANIQKYLLEE